MFLTSLLLSAAPLLPVSTPQNRREEVAQKYHALAAARDLEALGKLWEENVGLVLQTIDADLEGSLALWEKDPEAAPAEEIHKLQQRALFGARAASVALDEPIFLDYASSFVGWDEPQKRAFRAGQQVYARAAKELKEENHETAFEAAKETVERATALGDWWGAAMGYGAQGDAARHLGWFEDALAAYGLARQVNHALGLQYAEYRNLQGMLPAARAAERFQRALAIAGDLASYAEAFDDKVVLKSTLETKAKLEDKLGHPDEAAKTREALGAL